LNGTITPNGLHFERHHYGVKEVNPDQYILTINLFQKIKKFTLNDLRSKKIRIFKTFIECGGNSNVMYNERPIKSSVDLIHGLFSVSEWSGVFIKDLLKKDEKHIKKLWLEFTSYDKGSYNISLPISKIIDKAFLALYQNGEPLRPEQGYPVRLIVPGFEGSTHVKWLKQIDLRKKPVFSRNETSRYTDLLPSGKSRQFSFEMELKSVILYPSHGDKLSFGESIITGLAWSGSSKIKRVEISTDLGKTWRMARTNNPDSNVVRFFYPITWQGKEMIIQSRCMDENNKIQPNRKEFLRKMGPNAYYHNNAITSWKIHSTGFVEHVYI
jgi:sulfane dehydrogenase subunit SoxC